MKPVLLIALFISIFHCIEGRMEVNEMLIKKHTDTIPALEIKGNFLQSSLHKIDSARLQTFMMRHMDLKDVESDIKKFYRLRKYAFAWHYNGNVIEQASLLFNRVLQKRENGIQDETPYLEEFDNLMEFEKADVIEREIMLTAQYFYFARKVLGGITVQESKESEWFIPRPKRDYVTLLDTLLSSRSDDSEKILYSQYYELKKKLKQYYEINDKSSWIIIPVQKKNLKVGDQSPIVARIRKKLFLSHDLNHDNGSTTFDSSLYAGVQEFQRRYGLTEDGIIGRNVMKKLNESVDQRIEQIIINMERCRWLNNTTEKDYVVINIPDFRLTLYRNDSAVFNCKVVVGKLKNKTVNFKGNINQIVLNPYWYIPESIMRKEILPEKKRIQIFWKKIIWNGSMKK